MAGDWGAAGHIHLDQWQSSIRLDQSEPKKRTISRFFICYDNHMMAEHARLKPCSRAVFNISLCDYEFIVPFYIYNEAS